MKKILILAIIAIIIIIAIAYMSNKVPQTGGKIRIIASFYPLAEFAGQVGGANIEVVNITPAGVEPHDFEPTPRDIARVYSAKVFLLNGGGFDPWAEKIAPDLKKKGITVVNMAKHFDLLKAIEEYGTETGHKIEANDPHIWLDPILAKKEVEIIRDALEKIDPANAQVYARNAEEYISKLSGLDLKYKDGLSACAIRDAIVSHAAFGYLAKRYGINVIPIVISPEEEPSPKRIADLSALAHTKNINFIFFETLVNPKLAETIAQEVGAKTMVFNPIEGLSDEELAAGKSYISIMEENLNHLRTALGCK